MTKEKKDHKKYIFIITIIIVIIFIIISTNKTIINKTMNNTEYLLNKKEEGIIEKYNNEAEKFEIFDTISGYTFNENYSVKVINSSDAKYEYEYYVNNELLKSGIIEGGESNIDITLIEGDNKIEILVKKYNDEKILKWSKDIYYIFPYQKQFLEEFNKEGIDLHIASDSVDEMSNMINLINAIGIKDVRVDIMWAWIPKQNNQYQFIVYENNLNLLNSAGMNILAIINTVGSNENGDDKIISSSEELEEYAKFINQMANKFDYIKYFEICNEPNFLYNSPNGANWYYQMVKLAKENISKFSINGKVIVGGTEQNGSISFFNKILKYNTYKYSNEFSYHIYSQNSMDNYQKHIKTHNEMKNNVGGFIKMKITENGVSVYNNYSEQHQAETIVKQGIVANSEDIDKRYIYSFRNTGVNSTDNEGNFGIIRRDFTPKPSYYALKNYYENTNGAEYIGTVDIAEGLEAHVYDKDGDPKIIAWSNNTENNITIPYKNFSAKDLYGKDIEPDEKGNITITTSPVYLYDVDYNYFYQAISNTATSKYTEFKEKFAGKIAQISGLSSKIEQMENYMENVGKVETKIVESASINAMKKHYEIGDLILQAYKEGTLKVEDVKVSSMLDMLDDIGNSYEDLVTVSAQTVTEIETTNTAIQEVENLINNNQEVEIIYPSKILEFSKDYYEKASYINSLEEENPIKAGLIISKNLHSKLLASWANTFANIQIDRYVNDYIDNNPVTIEYSETNITNKNVKATLVTNADIQITNNSNSKEYTFEENGNFAFEYTIKGQKFVAYAIVNNIDKTPPTITGVTEGKTYVDRVTPIISDKNLQSVKIILNGETLENYQENTELTEEGIYELIATDKAGNTSTVIFQIIVNKDDSYKIEEDKIKNITSNTAKSEFDKKIGLSTSYTITRNGEEIVQDDIIATGDVLKTKTGQAYTLIVTGDINKDGDVNLKDFIKMRQYLLDGNNLDEVEMLAADCNLDGSTIGLKDFVRMRIIILTKDIV